METDSMYLSRLYGKLVYAMHKIVYTHKASYYYVNHF